MHELPITENILEIAVRHAAQAQAQRVLNIYLVIGQLSSVVSDSLQFYWDFVSQDTVAQGATLHFRRVEAELHCQDCGARYALDGESLACPTCHSERVQISAGEEFYLEAIDII